MYVMVWNCEVIIFQNWNKDCNREIIFQSSHARYHVSYYINAVWWMLNRLREIVVVIFRKESSIDVTQSIPLISFGNSKRCMDLIVLHNVYTSV